MEDHSRVAPQSCAGFQCEYGSRGMGQREFSTESAHLLFPAPIGSPVLQLGQILARLRQRPLFIHGASMGGMNRGSDWCWTLATLRRGLLALADENPISYSIPCAYHIISMFSMAKANSGIFRKKRTPCFVLRFD